VGAAQLVLGLWVAGATLDITEVEWYSLTAAGGLLVAAGPKLLYGASGPAWGPGLLTAAVPSALLAVVRPDAGRAVGVIVVAAVAMVLASRIGVRAPLVIGAATELWMAFGFTVRALPWPLATALVVGILFAAHGMRRERWPIPFYDTPLAGLR
jgi:hypothetical protein